MVDQGIAKIKAQVVELAYGMGFDLVRITSADALEADGRITKERIRLGYMDGMPWFTEERVLQSSKPQLLLPGAHSIIVVALSYKPPQERQPPNGVAVGRVARYAQWTDYHEVMKDKLRFLASGLSEQVGFRVNSRVFVDDSPLLERAVAQRAGLGWFGKNTNILTATHGSWVFLGAVITDLNMEIDEPLQKNCGECIRCIDACPTGAIVAPYVIDAPRCISYLTIECRGPIPRHLRHLIGDWVFGCDICQEVCPVNLDVPGASMTGLKRTGFSTLELVPLLTMTKNEFSSMFQGTPIKRAKWVGLKRNACVALGNMRDREAVPALVKTLQKDEPLVRGHAAWALGRIKGEEGLLHLARALEQEADPYVREEIELALGDQE
ncbi:tRNA epoxyqueuosine(34) reductase QueG [Dehalococcoidia bacterium]|nr:tRNA epoxyqueuosine(34) reductase QueG [Dehalococcoidia bacterium]